MLGHRGGILVPGFVVFIRPQVSFLEMPSTMLPLSLNGISVATNRCTHRNDLILPHSLIKTRKLTRMAPWKPLQRGQNVDAINPVLSASYYKVGIQAFLPVAFKC